MADVRVNNDDHECIIENYQVLKLEKYVLESTELDARKTENDFRNRHRHLSDEGMFQLYTENLCFHNEMLKWR